MEKHKKVEIPLFHLDDEKHVEKEEKKRKVELLCLAFVLVPKELKSSAQLCFGLLSD